MCTKFRCLSSKKITCLQSHSFLILPADRSFLSASVYIEVLYDFVSASHSAAAFRHLSARIDTEAHLCNTKSFSSGVGGT